MKNNFKVNFITNAIEVSTSFAKKASIYGSAEYLMLTNAQKAHPEYTLDIQKPKRTGIKGIDHDFMRNYIVTHDETARVLAEFEKLVDAKLPYPELKAWFIKQYPIFKDCKTRADWILAA